MKLLYAEDEKGMSEAVVDILTYHHYLVDAVYDGEDAIDYALAEAYDGIILDIMMPKKNGLEVLKTLRQAGNNTPVLLLTAKAEIEDRTRGLIWGRTTICQSPSRWESSLPACARCCAASRALRRTCSAAATFLSTCKATRFPMASKASSCRSWNIN